MFNKRKEIEKEMRGTTKLRILKKSNSIFLFLFVIAVLFVVITVARRMMFAVLKTCLQDRRRNLLRQTECRI